MTTRTAKLAASLHAVERRGHPWIYASAVTLPEGVRAGDVIEVQSLSGAFVGRGIVEPKSAIAIRLWTRDIDEALDDRLIERRTKGAWKQRQALLRGQDTDAFRLLHGEADLTPGIVCDIYGSCAVLQADGRAAESLLPAFGRAVADVLPHVRSVVAKSRGGGRGGESGEGNGSVEGHQGSSVGIVSDEPWPERRPSDTLVALVGELPGAGIVVREHGMRFKVDIEHGHKTGAYLDQRENRLLVRESASGRKVLNLFAYTGGFSIAAMLGGASGVTSVDLARPAIEAARKNILLNGFEADDRRIAFETSDVLDFLRRDRQQYGMVILDPPSLAHSMRQLPNARVAYKRLNQAALTRVAPGGLLVSGSCTRRITADDLERIVVDAARAADRPLKIIRRTGAAPDHPVIKAFPEGDYLTMIWAEVGR